MAVTNAPAEGLKEEDLLPFLNREGAPRPADDPMNTVMGFLNTGLFIGLMGEMTDIMGSLGVNFDVAGVMPAGTGFEAAYADAMRNAAPAPTQAPSIAPATPSISSPSSGPR